MQNQRQSIHGTWSSQWAFILAAAGAAVGLGNIWKFPYIAGENGGGAFVLIYLGCVALIGIPLLMAEILIGRRGKRNPVNTMEDISEEIHASRQWRFVGWSYVLCGFLILTYYSVIAGWAFDYILQSASGIFAHASAEQVGHLFTQLTNKPLKLMAWHSVVMLITMLVVGRGIRAGIEKAIYFMFPGMVMLLLILVGYSMETGAFIDGVNFLFKPDFSALTRQGSLVALGHAFFTLSLATGSIMMYGAYLSDEVSVTRGAVAIAIADTGIALLAGLAIFPIVFANHLEPSAGPGLIFQTLPIAFGHMPYGTFFATLFFIMLVFAALTSAISLLEPAVAMLMERYQFTRAHAVYLAGFVCWFIGLGTVFSFNYWQDIKIFGMTFFQCLDYLTANIMLPLSGLMVAIFVVWVMPKHHSLDELKLPHTALYHCWQLTTKYIVPTAIMMIFLDFMGII